MSDLDAILSASSEPCEVHICFAGSSDLTDLQLTHGAAISQALALRANYRPLLISHGAEPEPGKFNVVVGTVEQLRNYLTDQEAKRITKGYLGLQRMRPAGDTKDSQPGFVLLVAGTTPEDLDNAVLTLGLVQTKLPNLPAMLVRDAVLPENAAIFRQDPLEPNKIATFAQLRAQGSTFTAEPGRMSVDLIFPGYLRKDSDAEAKLTLHYFVRVRAFRSTGALKVQLNGHELTPSQTAPSSSSAGGTESSFVIPIRDFEYGRNVLEITTPAPVAEVAAKDLRIYSDSALTLPDLTSDPKLPDLQLTSRTFYPFVGHPDGSDVALLLADRERDTIDAAWTLLCRFAQSANAFLYAVQLTSGEVQPRRHVVVVGPYDHLPPAFRTLVSLRAFEQGHLDTPLVQVDGLSSGTNLKQLLEAFVGQQRKRWAGPAEQLLERFVEQQKEKLPAAVDQWLERFIYQQRKALAAPNKEQKPVSTPDVGQYDRDYGVIATAPPTMPDQGWSLVLTAFAPENLLPRVQSLVRAPYWDQLRGDIARWKKTPASFQARVPGQVHEIAPQASPVELPLGETLDFRIWVALVTGTLLLSVMLTARVLAKIDRVRVFRQQRR
ncbi:MAG: cellulose biosynthesis cyclic di-GMP-binding regulatory protein BcsB [Verrucomicrobia bacterium]|nr:cellulose biosynthesis cyclic di-GMP-binding regulatory protein BcsB [Verrucomicrobiota bacterium]